MAIEITPTLVKSAGESGACREFWVKSTGWGGLSSASSETVVNYMLSPFAEDVYIIEALMDITTLDTDDADLDIGISNDAAASSADDSLFDSPANNVAGVLIGIAPRGVAGVVRPKWANKDAATAAYITSQQNANNNASSLVFNLYLKCIPTVDLD